MKEADPQKGFTLIETMFVIGLTAIIGAAIFLALRVGEEQTRTADLKMTIQESAREALYKMAQELRETAPNQITITGGNSIRFAVPDPSSPLTSSYQVNWTNAHMIEYNVGGTGQQLIRNNTSTGELSVLANDVTGITFTGNGSQPTLVTITISVQKTLLNGRTVPVQPLTLTTQAEIRNVP